MRTAARPLLGRAERRRLQGWATARPAQTRLSRRARIILEAAAGRSNTEIARGLELHPETVARWRTRYFLNGLEGLAREAPRAGSGNRLSPTVVGRIVRATLGGERPTGSAWTTRSLGQRLGVSHMAVHRVWREYGLGSPRLRSRGRAPGRPVIDLAGAFVTPTARVLVFSVAARRAPERRATELPELVPNVAGVAEFAGPIGASSELVSFVRRLDDQPCAASASVPGAREALLVFLRDVERRARGKPRLEAVFDRPIADLGSAVVRWFRAHPRFRAFTSGEGTSWSESVEHWLLRWEPVGLDRASLVDARSFVGPDRGRSPAGPALRLGYSWKPSGVTSRAWERRPRTEGPGRGPGSPDRNHLGAEPALGLKRRADQAKA